MHFFPQAKPDQGVERVGGVADPGVAVVPVLAAVHALRQRRGGGSRHRSGGAVDQQLEALSEEEQKKLEEEEAAAAAEEAAAEGEGKEQTEISSDPATGVQPNVEQTN